MSEKQPLKNTELTAMIATGSLLLVVGLFVWMANTDFDPSSFTGDESNPAGQFLGSAIGTGGLMLLTLGWAAAAICRQIVDTKAPEERRQLRSNASISTPHRSWPSQPFSIGTSV